MANKNSESATSSNTNIQLEPLKLIYLILLIGYALATVLTPNLGAYDSNGPKFLSLALLNLATFSFLFTRKEINARPEWYFAFFRNGVGMVYVGLMIVSLLSFFKAINVLESVLHFAKIFTTFSAAYLVSILVMADKRNIRYLCVAMTLLLVYDSLTVFSGINNYIHGKLGSISEIKSIYSNKNILASSIFVKIPFALWLMVFNRSWLRVTGILGIFLALIATLFLSTRAFYLGTIALTITLLLYFSVRFLQSYDKFQLKLAGIYLTIVVFSFLIFSTTQRYLYPKTTAKALSIEARLATITDPGGGNRLETWKRSWHVFKEDPLLGVGLGNWKIATMKEENLVSPNFGAVFYKAHNDFIEITTETGIFGGLFFFAIFLLTGWAFIKLVFKKVTPELLEFLFLPTFGLLCYSVDAFFNFPQDRPEIQSLFAFYIGMAIVFSPLFTDASKRPSQDSIREQALLGPSEKSGNNLFRLAFMFAYGLVLLAIVYILTQNFISLKFQNLANTDTKNGEFIYSHPASMFLNGFPAIPNLAIYAEPIAVEIARYLIHENRNDEAIALLKGDKSNPYFVLPEVFIARAYLNQKNIDSSLIYNQKVYNLKPNFFENIMLLCDLLQQKGLQRESEAIMDKYFIVNKTNLQAWLYASSFYEKAGNLKKATSIIDSAAVYFPSVFHKVKQEVPASDKAIVAPSNDLYNLASVAFNAKKYDEAAQYYSELVIKEPGSIFPRVARAFCYFNMKEYAKSIQDLDFLISKGEIHLPFYNVYNLRGANYGGLGNKDEACKNYKMAADMGDKEGQSNYAKLCQK